MYLYMWLIWFELELEVSSISETETNDIEAGEFDLIISHCVVCGSERWEMGNCQAAEAATVVIQHPGNKSGEDLLVRKCSWDHGELNLFECNYCICCLVWWLSCGLSFLLFVCAIFVNSDDNWFLCFRFRFSCKIILLLFFTFKWMW